MNINNINGPYFTGYRASCDAMDSDPSSSSRDSRDSRDAFSVSPPLSVTALPQTFHNLMTMGEMGEPEVGEMYLNPRPQLRMVEQPTEKSRFRYMSEAKGVHGAIMGRNSTKSVKSYPTVELLNYHQPAVVRCSLFTAEDDVYRRGPSFHNLVAKCTEGRSLKDEPHTIRVNEGEVGNVARFAGMSIIHTAKEHKLKELVRKTKRLALEKRQLLDCRVTELAMREKMEITRVCEEKVKSADLNNVVTLCFECFNEDNKPICEPVFSMKIFNQKSALTNELKITRIDKHASPCLGKEEVYMLVEKVGKKNIKVRFFELNEDEDEVWSDFANFSDLDVHHQYAIVFRTPPYRNQDIESSVDVFVQLYRPSDGAKSEPLEFKYTPKEARSARLRKMPRPNPETEGAASASDPMMFQLREQLEELSSFPSITPSIDEVLNGIPEFRSGSPEFMEDLLLLSSDYSLSFDRLGGDLVTDSAAGSCGGMVAQGPLPRTKRVPVFETRVKKASSGADGSREEVLATAQRGCQEVKKLRSKATGKFAETLRGWFQLRTTEGDTAIHVAVATEDLSVLCSLLSEISASCSADILDITNDNGKTALHLAVELDQWKMVSALLGGGANPDVTNGIGRTALHLAVDLSHVQCVDWLVDFKGRKPDLNARDDHGWTPLHVSVLRLSVQTARKLCAAGADVNAADSRRRTPLHLACDEENVELVRFLVSEASADASLKDVAGNTARDIALVRQCGEILDILPNVGQRGDLLSEDSDSDEDDEDFEDAESNPSDSESSRDENASPMLHANTMNRLCAVLDCDTRWKRLADKLGFGFAVNGFDSVDSPAKALINLADLKGVSIDQLRSSLLELDEREALLIVDSNGSH